MVGASGVERRQRGRSAAAGAARRARPRRRGLRGGALIALVLITFQLTTYGSALAIGLVEERVLRISDLLLATIRSGALLTGKIVGIGAVATVQLLLAGLGATAVAAALARFELDATLLRAIFLALVWFAAGYALYAGLYAIGASTCTA